MNEQKSRRKKKMGKVQREKVRAERATAFNSAFTMGYNAGYEQALKDLAKENEK